MYVEYSPLSAKSYLDCLYLLTPYLQKCIYYFWVKILPPLCLDHSSAFFMPIQFMPIQVKSGSTVGVEGISHPEDPSTRFGDKSRAMQKTLINLTSWNILQGCRFFCIK